jgi:hypothetical protein
MLIAALLLLADTPGALPFQEFGDWAVACDNLRRCEMTSLTRDSDDWPEDGPRSASISREAGPQGGFEVVVDADKNPAALALSVDGKLLASATPKGEMVRWNGAVASQIVAALANGTTLTLSRGSTVVTKIWLSGSSAALRFIDAAQGRAGTVTAAVAKGSKPAGSVPAAAPPVRVAALRPSGRPVPFAAAERKRLAKAAGCDEVEDDADSTALETNAIGGGATLVLLPCGSGAYNMESVPVILRGGKASFADFDYVGDGGREAPTLINAWWDAKTSTLSAHAKGRGIGDCGEDSSYVWDGKGFRLVELRRMDSCRGSVNWLRTWKAEPVFR